MWKVSHEEEEEENDFEFVKIKTYVLKVHIHCEGCMHEVKKLLWKIRGKNSTTKDGTNLQMSKLLRKLKSMHSLMSRDGCNHVSGILLSCRSYVKCRKCVYKVKIDAQDNKVTVSGDVNGTTLIKKLIKSGKNAEFWPPNPSKSVNNDAYLKKVQSLMDSFASWEFKHLPVDKEIDNSSLERYLNSNHVAKMQTDDESLGWGDEFIQEWGSPDGRMKWTTNFPGYDALDFDRLNSLYAGFPAYEYSYQHPAMMNNIQGPWYKYPYPMMYTIGGMENTYMHQPMRKMHAFNLLPSISDQYWNNGSHNA